MPVMASNSRPPRTDDERKGRALRLLRELKGLTQEQAAEAVQPEPISVQAWQNYEAGKRRFKPLLVQKVTAALGATPDDLFLQLQQVPYPEGLPPEPSGFADAGLVGIVTDDGALHVKRFDHLKNGKLYARDLSDNAVIEYDLNHVASVHAVNLRGA